MNSYLSEGIHIKSLSIVPSDECLHTFYMIRVYSDPCLCLLEMNEYFTCMRQCALILPLWSSKLTTKLL